MVRKLFPRNGPSGCDSHDWMSRADQSFSRQKPAMCSRRLADRDRLALPVAAPDPHAEFQFVVEIAAWPERRRRLARQLALARSAAARPRPTAAPTRRGCDRRRARICSSASADCRGAKSGRPCARDGCRRRNPCSRRRRPADAACSAAASCSRRDALPRASLSSRRGYPTGAGATPAAPRAGSASSGFSAGPAAASAASRAAPENSPASSAAPMSRIASPIATPPRGLPPCVLNTPNGRFWMGNSAWPLADATQLRRAGSCVASVM